MKVYRRMNANPRRGRRGVTLVEMLVTLAVLLLVMALVVQIFQVATGSMSAAQITQRLDDDLRRLDTTIRSDLTGATARFTPPLDPKNNQGYFEYIENEFADDDGEDCDDAIRLTVKAPSGRPFVGRMWAKPPMRLMTIGGVVQPIQMNFGAPGAGNPGGMTAAERTTYFATQPITITSDYAEVIYFLRNGNLYRRVLLVAPERQGAIVASYSDMSGTNSNIGRFPDALGLPTERQAFTPAALGGMAVSWQGVNDLSAHPAPRGLPTDNNVNNSVRLNTLGDLTDRHNRFASPRFADDFVLIDGVTPGPDGIPDDGNADNVPDWYPSLYANVIEDSFSGPSTTNGLWNVLQGKARIRNTGNQNALAFPYLYRGAFSQAQNSASDTQIGWIHAPAPFATDGTNHYQFNIAAQALNYLENLNHNPLDLGDNLPIPFLSGLTNANNQQTYWGFPTWRETLAPEWTDPTFQVNQPSAYGFPFGLMPLSVAEVMAGRLVMDDTVYGQQLLPPLLAYDESQGAGVRRDWRVPGQAQLFTDGAGSTTAFFSSAHALWTDHSFEDDLILTNVRSFDVKAYDPSLADYADLGWGDDPRITPGATSSDSPRGYLGTGDANPTPYLYGNSNAFPLTGGAPGFRVNAYALINGSARNLLNETFAHEGRMPPLRSDFRFDAQYGVQSYNGNNDYDGNVGDDSVEIVRMRRIWDSWSTTYSKAPATGVNTGTGFPSGPPFSPPIYPSYPPPYPAPLRGIQIQVRAADPTNQRVKVLTIRQDFTDKL